MPNRLLALLRPVCAAALSLLVAACGGGGGDSDSGGDTPAPAPTPTPPQPDPLAQYQWFLDNTGQDTLSGIRPVAGIDLNLSTLYDQGIRGTGITVAVIDDGLDATHEDLSANVVPGGSINFMRCTRRNDWSTCNTDPTPSLSLNGWDTAHGTSVAGLIGMAAFNGKGGRGIAPEVRLKGFTLLSSSDADDTAINLFALGDNNAKAADVDVFNMSYGTSNTALPQDDVTDLAAAYERVLASTRAGKGGIYIKSSGNYFLNGEPERIPPDNCTAARQRNISCIDSATDPETSLFGIITTAAVTAAGQRSSYSSAGAQVWVAGFGGEYNEDARYKPSATALAQQPALLSTDWGASCQVGKHNDLPQTAPTNAINNGSASLIDPDCKYTAGFNGTSAAAPTVAGVAALMLQANPALTARDVRYLLARSARNDTWRAGLLAQPPRTTALGRVFDPGWHRNAAGQRFSRWYGYGLVDATAAVTLARSFQGLPAPVLIEAESIDGQTADIAYAGDVASTTSFLTATITQDITIEGIQIAFQTTHQWPSQLLITLESPQGTRIPVLLPYTSLRNAPSGFSAALLGANGFLGESAQGNWKLHVEDISWAASPYGPTAYCVNASCELQSFDIRLLGHDSAN